ncbi:MAG TPA: DeoR/GlpR family DNA-binding transcription regulator [Opitutaceae bacterium]|nr:DeoR/GlpR family DNA-binding transcription regulator [Opitutaceae bacterium]
MIELRHLYHITAPMRVPRHVVDARRRQLAELLQRHRYFEIAELCKEFGVSEATMRRDLANLEKNHLVTRTYGGALADFNLRFPSFRQRRNIAADAKRAMADKALRLLRPEMTVFFDNGTTVFTLTEALRHSPIRPLTCVTGNLPVADLLSEVEGLDVHLLGGQVLRRQSVLLGDAACRSAEQWTFDVAFFSAEGMTREGLWNSDAAVVALQRAVAANSRAKIALLDATKLGRTAPQFFTGWEGLSGLLTDASVTSLESVGIASLMADFDHITAHVLSLTASKPPHSEPGEEDEDERSDLTLPTSLL